MTTAQDRPTEEAIRLTQLLDTTAPDVEEAGDLERTAVESASRAADSGLDLDAAMLWTAVGYRLALPTTANAVDLAQALEYFQLATSQLSARDDAIAGVTATTALTGTAIAYARMPAIAFVGGEPAEGARFVASDALSAARKALESCPRESEWVPTQVNLLSVWAELLAHRHFGSDVTPDDAGEVRELATAVLDGNAETSRRDRYLAALAAALALARLGDVKGAIDELRNTERLGRSLRLPSERALCLDSLANLLVRQNDRATYPEAARLNSRAARQFKAGGLAFSAAQSYRAAGVLLATEERWAEALAAFRQSILEWEAVGEEAVLVPRANEATQMFAGCRHAMVLCLARLGRVPEAVVAADDARARRLRAMPRRFSADFVRIRRSRPDLADRYLAAERDMRLAEIAEHRLTEGESSTTAEQMTALTNQTRLAKSARRDIRDEIGAVEGLERVFAPITLRQIRASLPPAAIAAYLIPTPHGGVAVLVSRKTLSALPLPGLTSDAVSACLDVVSSAYDGFRKLGDQSLQQELDKAGKWLWEACMGDVLNASNGFERLVLLPSDGLDFLPLHAAWHEEAGGRRVYALDVMSISLAPCADLQPSVPPKRSIDALALVSVAEPAPVTANPLPAARTEAAAIRGALHGTPLDGEAATKQAMIGALPGADLVHFAGHGHTEFGLPYASHLLLANDEHLELSDIVDLELDRRPFLFLSACETGAHDLNLPDENQSLSSAFISAGATGVVSTLWPVFDDSSLLITVAYYDNLLKGVAPASALRQAQIWLRDATREQKNSDVEAMTWILPSVRGEVSARLAATRDDFGSCLSWAAHVYSGA